MVIGHKRKSIYHNIKPVADLAQHHSTERLGALSGIGRWYMETFTQLRFRVSYILRHMDGIFGRAQAKLNGISAFHNACFKSAGLFLDQVAIVVAEPNVCNRR
jgi:hypothetical protein